MKKTMNKNGIVMLAFLLNFIFLSLITFKLIDKGLPSSSNVTWVIFFLILLTLINLYVMFKFGVSLTKKKSSKNEKSLFGLWIAVKRKKLKNELNETDL